MTPLEQLERKSRLWHIEQSAGSILEYSQTRVADDLRTDRMFRMAVERELIIIGEALARALEVDVELANHIGDVRAIIGLRNQLVHNYPRIEPERIWHVIHDDLPRLLAEVRSLLS